MNLYKSNNTDGFNTINAINPNRQDNKRSLSGKTGDIISAIITDKINGKAFLKTQNDESFSVSLNYVSGETGDEVYFKIIKNDSEKIQLQQVFPEKTDTKNVLLKNMSIQSVKNLMTKADFIEPDEKLKVMKSQKEINADRESMVSQTISKIKRQMMYISNNTGAAAVGQLIASGLSLDKITLDMLESVTKEIEDNPFIETPKDLDGNEILSEILPNDDIEEALSQNNMPINDSNKKAINNALKKFDHITQVDDAFLVSAVKTGKSLTLENLYISKFSSSSTGKHGGLENIDLENIDFEKLMPEINKLFEREGVEKSKENYETAKLLIENEVDITKENIDKIGFIKNINKNLTEADIIKAAIANLKSDKNASDIQLDNVFNSKNKNKSKIASEVFDVEYIKLTKQYDSIISDMPEITKLDVREIVRSNTSISLELLQNKFKQDKQGKVDFHNAKNPTFSDLTKTELESKVLTTKRQILEISLKLTYESATGLINKNININTMPLENALKILKEEENEIYIKNLKVMNVEANISNVRAMSTLYEEIQSFSYVSVSAFSDVLNGLSFFSIRSISKAGNNGMENYKPDLALINSVAKNYEEVMETINPKYGDSYRKAEGQLPALIQSLGFDTTDANVRAARILSLNGMDITEEKLLNVKLIDSKVARIFDSLHPKIAAKMIGDGLNPSTMHIDDVLDYINSFEDQYGENTGGKLAKYIIEMDRSNTVSEQTREPIIAVYRMLNQILKNGGVSVGTTLKAEKNLTLGNLFQMSKVFKQNGGRRNVVDFSADDHTKIPESRISENNILNTLNKAYNDTLVKQFIDSAEPRVLNDVINEKYSNDLPNLTESNSSFMNVPLEQLIDELDEIKEQISQFHDKIEIDRILNQLRSIPDTPYNAIRFMDSNNIAITVANLNMMKTMLKQPNFTSKTLNELLEATDIDLLESDKSDKLEALSAIKTALNEAVMDTSLTELKQGDSPEEVRTRLTQTLEDITYDAPDGETIEKIDNIKRAILLSNASSLKRNAFLSAPIKINGKIAEINMYVLNDKIESKNEVNMLMSLNTDFGEISITIKTVNKKAQLTFTAENAETANIFSENKTILEDFVKSAGFTISNAKFLSAEEQIV